MTASSNDQECKLTCKSFFCSKRMLRIVNNNGKKSFNCTMDDVECLGSMCIYAECRERKMGDNGQCLRPIKSLQKANPKFKNKVQYNQYDYMTPNQLDDKLRKKLTKKLN